MAHLALRQPHAKQQEILASTARYNVVCLGRRAGKTVLGVEKAVRTLLRGENVLWMAPSYRILMEAYREFEAILAPVIRSKSKTDKLVTLKNGAQLEYFSLDDPEAGRSREAGLVVIDEAALVYGLQEIIAKAVRAVLLKSRGELWLLSTPRDEDTDFHRLYLRGLDPEDELWASWHAPTWSNPHIPISERAELLRDVEQGLLSQAAYDQEYEAVFVKSDGNLFQRSDFSIVEDVPKNLRWVRAWDLAMSSKERADESVGTLMASDNEGNIWVRDQQAFRLDLPDLIPRLKGIAVADGPDVRIAIERPLVGTAVMQALVRDEEMLPYTVITIEPKGRDKMTRAQAWATRGRVGKLKVLAGGWVEALIRQAVMFRGLSKDKDDRIDSVSVGMDLMATHSREVREQAELEQGSYEWYTRRAKDRRDSFERPENRGRLRHWL